MSRYGYELAEGPTDYDEDDLDLPDEAYAEDLDPGDAAELAETLRDALDDEYADADPDELDDALANVLESLSPAESFNFGKALTQIQRGAGQVLSDPAAAQVARTVLPLAGGAVGAAIGGPAGTALGARLGTAAVGALPARKPPRAPATPVAGGSPAAAQGLILTQQPEVLKSLLALAMGQHGRKEVNGVPVSAVMSMLSSVFGEAAADADELMYLGQDRSDEAWDNESGDGPEPTSTYRQLLESEDAELDEAVGTR